MSELRTVHVRWMGQYRTDISIRGVHRLEGDETPEYGGDDSGPMPTEFFLASVASCMCLAVSHMAQKRRIQLENIEVSANAEKDMEIFRFKELHLEIQADLPLEKLQPLVQQAKKYCFVSNTIIKGCPISITTNSTLLSK
ncbi:MAG: OsmC family protein [Candidatus Neomarinimicrobiota bacterium]|nr:OsmC family protein [Candidatus Neomarinimicrobiota bacterium]